MRRAWPSPRGQAAITAAILTICHAGQNFISATSLYGGTWTLFTQTFKKLGIEVRFFDPDHPEQIARAGRREHPLRLPGEPRQPEERRARLPRDRRRGAQAIGLPVIVRQHGDDAGAAAAHRPRRRHRRSTRPPSSSAATACTSAAPSSTAASSRGPKDPQRWPEFCAPDPPTTAWSSTEALEPDRQHRLHHPHPHALAARHRRAA